MATRQNPIQQGAVTNAVSRNITNAQKATATRHHSPAPRLTIAAPRNERNALEVVGEPLADFLQSIILEKFEVYLVNTVGLEFVEDFNGLMFCKVHSKLKHCFNWPKNILERGRFDVTKAEDTTTNYLVFCCTITTNQSLKQSF